jgi:hypothetical protein
MIKVAQGQVNFNSKVTGYGLNGQGSISSKGMDFSLCHPLSILSDEHEGLFPWG